MTWRRNPGKALLLGRSLVGNPPCRFTVKGETGTRGVWESLRFAVRGEPRRDDSATFERDETRREPLR